MRRRIPVMGVGILTAAAVLAACGGSSGSAGGKGVGDNIPIKVGVLTSLSGPFASGFTTTEKGVKARIELENASGGVNGHKLQYVMGDDGNGADAAISKLVQQDKVFGILSISPSFSQGAGVAARSGVPVFGSG